MATFTELSLFSGAGGGLLATQHLLGWRTICAVPQKGQGKSPVQIADAVRYVTVIQEK
jgi:hypothetical protein